jgi:hypothetical protein
MLVSFSLTIACQPFPPARAPFIPDRSPEDIVAALEDHPNSFPSFRAAIEATIIYPFEKTLKKHSFDAALLYRKEEKTLRIQGFGIFGNTYFDVVYRPDAMTLYLPPESAAFSGNPSELVTGGYDIGAFLAIRQTLEGIRQPLDRAHISFSEGLYSPVVADQGGQYFLLALNPETLLIDQKLIFHNRRLAGKIRYGDYEYVDGLLLPQSIRAELPQKNVTFEFHFESISLEESLSQSLFRLAPPDSTKWYPLTALRIDFLL